jgi:hypothetical protein
MLELRLERALQSLRAAQAALKQAQEASRLGAVASAVGGGLSSGQRRAVAPAGGIAALSGSTPGSGTVTFREWDGTSVTLGSETATAYNDWPGAVPASAELVVEQVYGTDDWFVVGWWCP